MITLEAQLYAPLCAGANLEGWRLFRIVDGGFIQKPGDIVGADLAGRAVLLEVKTLQNSLNPKDPIPWKAFSAHQKNWLCAYAGINALALVALYGPKARMSLYRIWEPVRLNRPAIEWHVGELTLNDSQVFCGWGKLRLGKTEH